DHHGKREDKQEKPAKKEFFPHLPHPFCFMPPVKNGSYLSTANHIPVSTCRKFCRRACVAWNVFVSSSAPTLHSPFQSKIFLTVFYSFRCNKKKFLLW